MKTFIVFAALVAAVSCFSMPTERELHGHWQKFKAEHSKTYKSAIEEAHRMKIFKENAILVAKHNDRYQRGEVTYKVAISKFADLLTHEIIAKRNGYRSGIKQRSSRVHNVTVTNALASPSRTVDWRTKGYVTPIKDQGQCGSCWAFSATGALEAQLFRKTGKLISLSEQNIVDCSRNYGVFGCDGGYSSSAFQYIHDNGGIDTERSYPYEDRNGRCRYSKENNAGTATGYVDIAEGSEAALQDAVARVGPVSVAIDASGWGFQFYDGGIYSDLFCSTDELDHAVLAVGFGSEGNNKDYWIVKNSWGEEWGEKGYIRMTRNKRNQCGIASEATYPTV